MPCRSTIELRDLQISTDIGTYGPEDVVPRAHLLDLVLSIDPSLVLIERDGMEYVFDYDPLIAQIGQLARDGHYATQERLVTRIVQACAAYREIDAVEVMLRKEPVVSETGSLGVRIAVDTQNLQKMPPDELGA